MTSCSLSFGDNVRVRPTPDTTGAGLAGQTGQIYGVTTPSITGVAVIGSPSADLAFAVQFQGRQDAIWFSEEVLEFIDHGPGSELQLAGVGKKWTREADGSWTETSSSESSRPWWKFW